MPSAAANFTHVKATTMDSPNNMHLHAVSKFAPMTKEHSTLLENKFAVLENLEYIRRLGTTKIVSRNFATELPTIPECDNEQVPMEASEDGDGEGRSSQKCTDTSSIASSSS
mmetsp:Transcript_20422/g.35238  ORF Transcript_20422/g.35238 Transcript_20422/m.35238 type:complete len:112 (+) Transcript_20422:559-894(+)|eukprot:CAMPEP_0184701080 /NCGR_PEP_ID=MMETSP0313-20130426/17996_1 /TAXON_ID=2792 /ORGANISM="Porphyridium aerugineum, Strain SAG 1380-2" /LENGTH=111 /DNA_ID=CAMNT_0027161007 /DNA_START=477 /DNA_END=812 /DNA_ORIENTATION=-